MDGADPLNRLGINLRTVIIKSLQPFFLCVVIQLFGSFPCSQARITLSSTKMWLSPRLVWSSSLGADIKSNDFLLVFNVVQGIKVLVVVMALGASPSIPNCHQLYHQLDGLVGALGQVMHTVVECPGFGLLSRW